MTAADPTTDTRHATEQVVLVDASDAEIGTAEKLDAHRRGLLHRAFSVLIFNDRGELLLQRRAAGKYHSPGLWSNSCCGHPRPGEAIATAAARRLGEELGLSCALTPLFAFTYCAELSNGIAENEIDHVFVGVTNAAPQRNPEEVDELAWCAPEAVTCALECHPERYTVWFPLLWKGVIHARGRA